MKNLGCRFISEENGNFSELTHLVATKDQTTSIHPTRPKFLLALSCSAHIVTLQWLESSHSAGAILPVDNFLIDRAEAAETEHNFSLQRSIANGILNHSNGGIFHGLCIYLVAGVAGAQGPSRATFRALFAATGATERTKTSVKKMINNGLASSLLIITSDPPTSQQMKDVIDAESNGAIVITFSKFVAVLLNQSLEGIPIQKEALSPKLLSPSKKAVGFAGLSPKKLFSPRATAVSTTKREEWSLLFSSQIPNLIRHLSDNVNGDQNRGNIGPSTMNIISSNITGRKRVEVFDSDQGRMRLQAIVPPTFRGIFGNAGTQPKMMWDAYDTSGNISTGAHLRTFEFTFRSREQMTIVMFIMFGGHSGADADNAVKLTENFFDEDNEIFCPQTPSKPPFPTIEPENDMSIDEVNETPFLKRPPPMSPKTANEEFGNDTMEYSQVC